MTSSCQEILLASSSDGLIMAYDASTGATLAHFSGSQCLRRGLTLAGKTIVAASHVSSNTGSGSISLYNWWSSAAFYQLPMPEPVAPLAATADGLFLFAGGLSGQIHTLSLPSGDLVHSLPVHHKPITCLTVNDDGSLLVSGGDDGLITILPIFQLLDVNFTWSTLHQFSAHSLPITAIVSGIGGYNSTIVSCSSDCTCKFWNLANGAHLRTIQFPCPICCATMDPTEWEFYAGGSDGRVYAGALKVSRRQSDCDAEVVAWSQEHSGAVTALVITNEGRSLVSASEDASIRVWEVESGRVVRVVGQERASVTDLLVAKGIRGGGSSRAHNGMDCGGNCQGFSSTEICRPVKEVMEIEEWLGPVVKDRKRAIDMLEGAIGTYEKLLKLFLNEARGDENKEGESPQ